jgi:hypothetical protein
MSSHRHVYVFITGDRRMFGLTYNPDGANLPPVPCGWQNYDQVPVCRQYLSRYAEEPEAAHANLTSRGYHLADAIGNIVPLPKTKLCSMMALSLVAGARPN